MKRVIIAGGGISGLICSHIFKQHRGVEVMLLEPGNIGGEFLAGGLKYIHRTEIMEWLFEELDVMYSPYTIQGGIMLRGGVHPYPKCLMDMELDESERIQSDHYRKTRRTEPGEHSKKAMNDPASVKPRRALRCDIVELVEKLASRANVIRKAVVGVEKNHVVCSDHSELPYDYLVLTIPMWIIKKVVKFNIPDGMAMRLNVAKIHPKKDKYARWDYVYTPYTPADVIHRFSPDGGGYVVEANGDLKHSDLHSDLNFIFPDGWYIDSLREGLKGHLLPLECQPEWPNNVAPLGRFAKWDSRATTDVTIEDAMDLAQGWFR